MTTTTPAAGWYPDPLGSEDHRYWNGSAWTEHTTPVVTAPGPSEASAQPATAPSNATPSTPAQPMPIQPMPVQPMPVQPMPVQPMPFTSIPAQAMPAQTLPASPSGGTPFPGDPFAYRWGPTPAQRHPGYGYPRPAGRSAAATVLIGIAAAVGVLFVVGILAAIAIPVFLNERAKTHPPTGVAPVTHSTTVTVPETAAGLTRATSPSAQQLVQRLLSLDVPGRKAAGVYDDASGRRRATLIVSRYAMSPAEQQTFLRGAESASGLPVDRYHPVAPGPLGGQMQCASVATVNGTTCLFFDGEVVGNINVLDTTRGDALAVQLREAVEHRS